jgi:class 3 adenylate cyclase
VHTGEVELRGDDVGGIAVHIASRVSSNAAAGEILVSRTVTDLVTGSGMEFADRGAISSRRSGRVAAPRRPLTPFTSILG